MDLAGNVAIVTGASRGIGRDVAIALGRRGCHVALAARTAEQIVQVADEIQKLGQQAIAVTTDITRESDVAVLVDRAHAVFGAIDIYVHASNLRGAPGFDDEAEPWSSLVATCLTGPYLCTRAIIPVMKQQAGGSIVLVADGEAIEPEGNTTAYATVQAGLVGMSKSLARELSDDNIQVNAVCPKQRTETKDATEMVLTLASAENITGASVVVG